MTDQHARRRRSWENDRLDMGTLRKLLSTERRAWLAVAVYSAILYSTLAVAFDLYVAIYDSVGREKVSFWMNAGFVVAGLLLIGWLLLRYRPRLYGYVTLVIIGLAIAFCLSELEVPAKRFHFFQYGPLTLLVLHALRFRCRDRGIYVWCFAFVFIIGLGDETIQALLPDRHFGVIDLVINSTAALLTLALSGFVIEPRGSDGLKRR